MPRIVTTPVCGNLADDVPRGLDEVARQLVKVREGAREVGLVGYFVNPDRATP